ncbi:MAG: DUF2281 domain-containing protein [Gemmatimonadota bacterium]
MHDALRQRLMRRIESLPDEQIYQVLDYIEFLEAKYADMPSVEASGLQRFAETLEDKLRRKAVSPATIREAFQLISAADRVLSGVSSAGKQILSDLNSALESPGSDPRLRPAEETSGGGGEETPGATPSPDGTEGRGGDASGGGGR